MSLILSFYNYSSPSPPLPPPPNDPSVFSDVTKSGRVWRKVPESDARSVGETNTWSLRTTVGRFLQVLGAVECYVYHFVGQNQQLQI